MLKADMHIHTREDPLDSWISYSARDLIKYAAKLRYNVLAVTNHGRIFYNSMLSSYAKKQGILMIPGVEANIEGKEVLLLNVKEVNTKKISDLDKLRKENALVIAPHPFYPRLNCLHSKLIQHINSFDAVEYSHFYYKSFDLFNQKAIETARRYKKALIGTSDAHHLFQMNHTYSLIDSKQDIDSVLEAVRKNKVIVRTEPLPLKQYLLVGFEGIFGNLLR